VRHHRQVTAVGGAQGGDTAGRPVGVLRVGFGDAPRVVSETDGGQAFVLDPAQNRLVGEERAALAVRGPDPES